MEKKQEEQAGQMKKLQDRAKHLQHKNDRLRAQVEKRHDLGKRDAQHSSEARYSTTCNKGKEPIVPNNVDTPADDELSSGSLPHLSPTKSNRAKSHQG